MRNIDFSYEFVRISGFQELFSRSVAIREIFRRQDAGENVPCAGINIGMKTIFEFKENRDSSPFWEFSSLSGFRRLITFVVKSRIDPRTGHAGRSREEFSLS